MALPKISIEDFDNRCVEVFPNSGERCWGMAVKVIKRNGQSRNVCLAHYEKWLEQLVAQQQREGGKN
jgi:hypothetical protein